MREGNERAVEEANDGESDHERGDGARLRREQSEIEAEDGVEAELACDDHGHRGRRFLNDVGEPAVEREDGNLDGEGDQESQRNPPQSLRREGSVGEEGLELNEVEGVRFGVEPKDGDQKQRGGNKGVEEELDGGGSTAVGAEHRDENRHGHQGQLPETVIEEQIEGDEDADHGGLLQEEEEIELAGAGLDGAPGDEDADGSEERGEQNQPQGKAVDAEVIADRGRGRSTGGSLRTGSRGACSQNARADAATEGR